MSSYMHTHIYADERAREFEVAARERQMGCSPLCGMLSKVVMKCNGRQGRTRKEKLDYAMAYPPVQTCYMRPPVASNHAIPVTAQFTPTPGAGAPPPRARGGKPRKRKKSKHVRFNPAGPGPGPGPAQHPAGPRPAQPPHAAHAYQQHAAGTSGGDQSQQQHHAAVASGPYYSGPATPGDSGYESYSYGGYYAPSPLTRWEMLGGGGAGTTPRRHYEYFSGEYRWSYPTPVRQGIYSMATDANRLTAIFSEENPNACAIV